jgi:DNA polymerase
LGVIMPILHRDFESKSTVDLKKAGAWRYAVDPSTDVWCCAYAIDAEPVQLWIPGDPIPPAWIEAANDDNWIVTAHHDAFERRIEQHIMGPRYGWPIVPFKRHRCTMAAALAVALPAKLENAAAALQLTHRKSDSGVMLQMAKPRKPRRGEDPNGIYWFDDEERRRQLYAYCRQDVEVERELHHRLPPLSPAEQELWLLDQIINDRGFHVDRALAEAARRIVSEEQVAINKQLAELTGGAASSIDQVQKIVAYVRNQGHQLGGLTKRSVSAVLAHNPSDDVREILELRRTGARASVRKLDALFDRIDGDDRLRDTLQFHAAATGRWAGRGFQPQNLKKPEGKDIDAAINAVLTGDLESVRQLGAPLSVTGDISRSIICAAPGHVLIGADFSAIESRVLAWCTGEEWKLKAYRDFDRAGDDKLEPYCIAASKILKRTVTKADEAGRAIGKICDLAFGYGGGLGAWRNFDRSDAHTDADVERFKKSFRQTHAATVRFWHRLERAAHRAVRTGQPTKFRMFSFTTEGGTLFMALPSGRRLAYPEARVVAGRFEGTRQLQFKDNSGGRWGDSDAWYGTLVENAVQAISRDILAAAMRRLEAAGYPIVLHVHDEIVAEVPEGHGDEAEFLEIMTARPDWAVGLPIAAKPWSGDRYAKTKLEKKPENIQQITSPRPAQPAMVQPAAAKATPEPDILVERAPEPPPWEGMTTFEPVPAAAGGGGDTEDGDGLPALAALIDAPLNDSGMMKCVFHAEDNTPSLKIYHDHFHCFGCEAHGDRVDWLMRVKGMERGEALLFLDYWQGGPVSRLAPERDDEDKTSTALKFWDRAKPIAGTLAEKYLADVRRIDVTALPENVDEVLRFHRSCPFGPGTRHPCLLALLRDATTDESTGIQRIALTPAVFKGGKVERMVLGRLGAAKFWPANSHLVIGEGIETVLAAATRVPYKGEPLRPAWAAISAGRLRKFPVITDVEQLIILVDHDENGRGQAAAVTCASRWSQAGRRVVRLMRNRPGDFNDIILEKCHA